MSTTKTAIRLAAVTALACAAAVPLIQTAGAAANPAVGTYSVADMGAGGAWQGGPLFADGSLGGGGIVEFPPPDGGQFILRVIPLTWQSTDNTVVLCFNFTQLQPKPEVTYTQQCTPPLPVTGGTVQMVDPGTGALAEVHVSFFS
jgi:hypothetical protein